MITTNPAPVPVRRGARGIVTTHQDIEDEVYAAWLAGRSYVPDGASEFFDDMLNAAPLLPPVVPYEQRVAQRRRDMSARDGQWCLRHCGECSRCVRAGWLERHGGDHMGGPVAPW